MKNDLYTIPQSANICSVGRTTMWRWVKSGELKAYLTPGGQHKIRKEDLESFIREKMKYLKTDELTQEKKILIVDDDSKVQMVLNKILSSNGYYTEIASNGFEAGIKVIQFQPDLIILDLYMPGMDGFEVCEQIKKNPNTSHIKIIAHTGYDTKKDKNQIMKAGADGYLVKPVGKSKLLQDVENLLGK